MCTILPSLVHSIHHQPSFLTPSQPSPSTGWADPPSGTLRRVEVTRTVMRSFWYIFVSSSSSTKTEAATERRGREEEADRTSGTEEGGTLDFKRAEEREGRGRERNWTRGGRDLHSERVRPSCCMGESFIQRAWTRNWENLMTSVAVLSHIFWWECSTMALRRRGEPLTIASLWASYSGERGRRRTCEWRSMLPFTTRTWL
mmetsp:Transcript_25142/g.47269  ORF Transcript_25142/g.47269 Transcript_25142/m.47269 type:complete len:201 (-) Transcript_25142:1128-1730(-)